MDAAAQRVLYSYCITVPMDKSTFQRVAAFGCDDNYDDERFQLRVFSLLHVQERQPVLLVQYPIVPAQAVPGRVGEQLRHVPDLSPPRVLQFRQAPSLYY